jgi:hypothetical protein
MGAVAILDSAPRWIASSLEVKEGRDPLGLQTTTQDRLMPVLLPGILELSRRARYFSFHAFLLDEYRRKRLPVDRTSLSTFIKRREWDLALAVERCPRKCGSSPVGARRVRGPAAGSGPFARGESVDTTFGGYGLYYRTPLGAFGIVAKSGTLLGDEPIPIDVLYATQRASRLAEGFRSAIQQTAYYRRWMWTDEDLPANVVDEYAAVACLCRLREQAVERDAVHDALFGTDPPDTHSQTPRDEAGSTADLLEAEVVYSEEGVAQRRRSFGHYLTLVRAQPDVTRSPGVYREGLWSPTTALSERHLVVSGQWAALIAKDIWQEAICSVWSEFCRVGLARTRDLARGLTWQEMCDMARSMVAGPPKLAAGEPTSNLVQALDVGKLTISDSHGGAIKVAAASMEELRSLTAELDSASSGLILILELARRAGRRTGGGWDQAAHIASAWQPSVAAVIAGLRTHLEGAPSISETLWWLVSRFVLPVHERISYSKLPEFAFRFRWEDGLLRFYDNGIGRFPLAAIRHETLATLTWDLGLWDAPPAGHAVLTERGSAFVDGALT